MKYKTLPRNIAETIRKRKVKEQIYIYLLLTPSISIIVTFWLIPSFWNVYLSFTSGGLLGSSVFVGLRNYVHALQDPIFLKSLRNTFVYAATTICLVVALGLLLSMLLQRLRFLKNFFRGVIFFPMIPATVITAFAWSYVIHYDAGPLNYLLSLVGIPRVNWLGDPNVALSSIILFEVWRGLGFYVLVFYAAIMGIPEQLYEGARLDGASEFRIMWSITLPLIKPAITFAMVMAIIWNFQIFDSVFILTYGGPIHATSTVVWYVYIQSFAYDKVGLGATMAVFLLAIILVLSFLQFRIFRSKTEY